MKVKLHGGGVFYGPHGVMESHAPGSVIETDDSDQVAVDYWLERVDAGAAELIEEPATKTKASKATKATAKASDKATTEGQQGKG